jgi:eight-cysteine-cluster-containing protein
MKRFLLLSLLATACGGKTSNPPPPEPAPPVAMADCEVGGCSGTACSEPGKQVITTCEYKAEYACYQSATCTRQTDGNCGWTQSAELQACLANPPPMAGPPKTPASPTSPTQTSGIAPNPM